MNEITPFFSRLRTAVAEQGGLFNAHLHLDRAGTLEATDGRGDCSLSIWQKHGLIPAIHASKFYEPGNLTARLDYYLDRMIEAGTTRADTLVSITDDGLGRRAFEVYLETKHRRRDEIELGIGAYSPLGFREDEPGRWQLVAEAACEADFIGSLPERDDTDCYPNHIGFLDHCRRMLNLAGELGKPIQIHVDQRNDASERGAETVLQALDEVGLPATQGGEPMVWLIHLISPSTYTEDRFQLLLEGMVRHNVGVICCPSAAISMRQLRPLVSPTFNSVARVLDLLAAGVQVRLGSDNICDILSPAGTTDLVWEVFVLCNAIRYYDEGVLARLAAGKPLSPEQVSAVQRHLAEDAAEVSRVIEKWASSRPSALGNMS